MLTLPLRRVLLAIHFRLRGPVAASVYCGFSNFSLMQSAPPRRPCLSFFREEYLRVPLVYFNTPPRGEIDGTRYELAAAWKSRRLGADFDNKKKKERRENRIE